MSIPQDRQFVIKDHRTRASGCVRARRRRAELREGGLVLEDVDDVAIPLTTMRLTSRKMAVDEADRRVVDYEAYERKMESAVRKKGKGSCHSRDKMAPLFP